MKKRKAIDLDEIAGCKDADILLGFGGAKFVIQYRVENALRPGHPFVDIVSPDDDSDIVIDMLNEKSALVRAGSGGERVVQILLGQKLVKVPQAKRRRRVLREEA